MTLFIRFMFCLQTTSSERHFSPKPFDACLNRSRSFISNRNIRHKININSNKQKKSRIHSAKTSRQQDNNMLKISKWNFKITLNEKIASTLASVWTHLMCFLFIPLWAFRSIWAQVGHSMDAEPRRAPLPFWQSTDARQPGAPIKAVSVSKEIKVLAKPRKLSPISQHCTRFWGSFEVRYWFCRNV